MRWRILLKYNLAILALVLAAALLFWQRDGQLGVVLNNPRLATTEGELSADKVVATPSGVTVDGVRYSGQDASGNRWQLIANSAAQPNPTDPIYLQQVRAQVQQKKNADLFFSANEGYYQPQQQTLELAQQVVLHMAGATLTTRLLSANLATQAAQASGMVTLTLPQGVLTGQNLIIAPNTTYINLNGPVKAVFNLGSEVLQ